MFAGGKEIIAFPDMPHKYGDQSSVPMFLPILITTGKWRLQVHDEKKGRITNSPPLR